MTNSAIRLNLGCGRSRADGWTNVDAVPFEGVDVVFDLTVKPWPWGDDSVEEIAAIDLIEHLDDFIGFFDEAWRVLKRGGTIRVKVPRADHPHMWSDPTHRRPYTITSFQYLTGLGLGARYEYTTRKWLTLYAEDGVDIHIILSPIKDEA